MKVAVPHFQYMLDYAGLRCVFEHVLTVMSNIKSSLYPDFVLICGWIFLVK